MTRHTIFRRVMHDKSLDSCRLSPKARSYFRVFSHMLYTSKYTWYKDNSFVIPGIPLECLLCELEVAFFYVNSVFAKKIFQPIIPSNLKKARFIPASLRLCLRCANRRNSITSQKNTNLVSKKGKIGWHPEAQYIFSTRRRGTRM